MIEVWKAINGYEGYYEVSNLGRVRSIRYNPHRILRGNSVNGYIQYSLSVNGSRKCIYGHQLVAIAFLGHKPNGHKLVCNHKNFNRADNSVSNLEIITQRENTSRSHIKSRSKYVGVSWFNRDSKWLAKILVKGRQKHIGLFESEIEASKAYNEYLNKLKQ
jgi:hypothetical protein